MLTLTLPRDVVAWLRTIHPDPGWALVTLYRRQNRGSQPARRLAPPAQLVAVPGGKTLILVNPRLFRRLPGVSIIPLSDGRGFLALDAGRGLADVELALADRMEAMSSDSPLYRDLLAVRAALRRWRRLPGLRFQTRSILVAQRTPVGRRVHALSEIATRRRGAPRAS